MKRLLYFLIGCLISACVMIPYAKADCVDLSAFYSAHPGASIVFVDSLSAGNSASLALYNSQTWYTYGAVQSYEVYGSVYVNFILATAKSTISSSNEYHYWVYSPAESDICTPDTDGDGISDANDKYPNDPNPYLIRLVGEYKDDQGNVVCQVWETDRDDYYLTGTLPDNPETADFTLKLGTAWQTPNDQPLSDSDFPGMPTTDVPTTGGGAGTGSDPAPGMPTGDPSGTGDSDSDLTRKIADNTSKTVEGLGKLSGYAKSLDDAIAGMGRNVAIGNQTLKDIEDKIGGLGGGVVVSGDGDGDEEEASTGLSDFNNTDVGNHYNSDNYNGTLTPGTDYVEVEDLKDLSWFSDFFSDNPLKTALNSSGFDLSSSVCALSFTIDGMGTHTLSLCEFESGFIAAGNLLLSFTSLSALMIVAWR